MQVYRSGKINVLLFDLKESREGVFIGEEGEGHSVQKGGRQKGRGNQH